MNGGNISQNIVISDRDTLYTAVMMHPLDNSAINEISNHLKVNIFPNPASNQIAVNINTKVSTDLTICITNLRGQMLYKQLEKSINGDYNKTIDLSRHGSGVYLIEIGSDKETFTREVILK